MAEFRVRENNIMIGVWLNGDNGNVVLAPGIPQYLDKYHPLVQQMKRLRYNLFVPRYKGTWESDGEFTINNSRESIECAVELANRGNAVELYANSDIRWDTKKISVIGF